MEVSIFFNIFQMKARTLSIFLMKTCAQLSIKRRHWVAPQSLVGITNIIIPPSGQLSDHWQLGHHHKAKGATIISYLSWIMCFFIFCYSCEIAYLRPCSVIDIPTRWNFLSPEFFYNPNIQKENHSTKEWNIPSRMIFLYNGLQITPFAWIVINSQLSFNLHFYRILNLE